MYHRLEKERQNIGRAYQKQIKFSIYGGDGAYALVQPSHTTHNTRTDCTSWMSLPRGWPPSGRWHGGRRSPVKRAQGSPVGNTKRASETARMSGRRDGTDGEGTPAFYVNQSGSRTLSACRRRAIFTAKQPPKHAEQASREVSRVSHLDAFLRNGHETAVAPGHSLHAVPSASPRLLRWVSCYCRKDCLARTQNPDRIWCRTCERQEKVVAS